MTNVIPSIVYLFYGARSGKLEGIVFHNPDYVYSTILPVYPGNTSNIFWWRNIYKTLTYRSVIGAPVKLYLDEGFSGWYKSHHKKWTQSRPDFSPQAFKDEFLYAAICSEGASDWIDDPVEGLSYMMPAMPGEMECSGVKGYGSAESFVESKYADTMVFGFRRYQLNVNPNMEYGAVVWSPEMDSINFFTDPADFFECLSLFHTRALWMGNVQLTACGRIPQQGKTNESSADFPPWQDDITDVFRNVIHRKVEDLFSMSERNKEKLDELAG